MLPKRRYMGRTGLTGPTDIENLQNTRDIRVSINIELYTNASAAYKPPQTDQPRRPIDRETLQDFLIAPSTDIHFGDIQGYEKIYDLKPIRRVENILIFLEFEGIGLEQEIANGPTQYKQDLTTQTGGYLGEQTLSALAYEFSGAMSL